MAPNAPAEHYVEHASPEAFESTLARLRTAIADAGMTLFAQIDHAAAAQGVGMAMPPTTVLIFGNPRGGTPAMLAAPRAALDLPLRVLVREESDGRVRVGFHPVTPILHRAGVPEDLGARLAAAQAAILKAI